MPETWESRPSPTVRQGRADAASPRGSLNGRLQQTKPVNRVARGGKGPDQSPGDTFNDILSIFNDYDTFPIFESMINNFFTELTQYMDTHNNISITNFIEQLIQEINQYFETHNNETTNNFGDVLGDLIYKEIKKFINKEGDKNNIWGDIINKLIKGIVYVQPNEPDTNAVGTLWFDTDEAI